jgi:hypothetical protein
MRRDRPVVFDVSSIDDNETDLQAAIMLACWSTGFGSIAVSNALADAGLEPRRHYVVVLDELWRVLRAGQGIVDRVDALTRLNRTRGDERSPGFAERGGPDEGPRFRRALRDGHRRRAAVG